MLALLWMGGLGALALAALSDVMPPAREGEIEETVTPPIALGEHGGLRLRNEHGGVSVAGGDAPTLRVVKRVRGPNAELAARVLADFRIEVDQEPDGITIHSERPRPQDYGLDSFAPQVESIEAYFELVVPECLVELDFQHGDVSLSDLRGPVTLSAANGSVQGARLSGLVMLRHEHGPVSLAGLQGGLEAKVQHGPIEVRGVHGDLKLQSAHGRSTISEVAGIAEVAHEHGELQIEAIDGRLTMHTEQSHVRVRNVRGPVDLDGGPGDWEIEDVQGPVQLSHAEGRVHLKSIGSLSGRKSDGELVAEGVGDVQLESYQARVALSQVSGNAVLHHDHGPLEARGLGGALELNAEQAHVKIEYEVPLPGPVQMRLDHCHAMLRLPSGSSARLALRTEHGHLEVPGLAAVPQGDHRMILEGTLGTGQHPVTMEGHHSFFQLATSEAAKPATAEASRAANDPSDDGGRRLILEMVSSGKITPDQAERLLRAVAEPTGTAGREPTGEPRSETARRASEREALRAAREAMEAGQREARRAAKEAMDAAQAAMRAGQAEAMRAAKDALDTARAGGWDRRDARRAAREAAEQGAREAVRAAQDAAREGQREAQRAAREAAEAARAAVRGLHEVLRDLDPGKIVNEVLRDLRPGDFMAEARDQWQRYRDLHSRKEDKGSHS